VEELVAVVVGRATHAEDDGSDEGEDAGSDEEAPAGLRARVVAHKVVLDDDGVLERRRVPEEEQPRGKGEERRQEGDHDQRNPQLAPELQLLLTFTFTPDVGACACAVVCVRWCVCVCGGAWEETHVAEVKGPGEEDEGLDGGEEDGDDDSGQDHAPHGPQLIAATIAVRPVAAELAPQSGLDVRQVLGNRHPELELVPTVVQYEKKGEIIIDYLPDNYLSFRPSLLKGRQSTLNNYIIIIIITILVLFLIVVKD